MVGGSQGRYAQYVCFFRRSFDIRVFSRVCHCRESHTEAMDSLAHVDEYRTGANLYRLLVWCVIAEQLCCRALQFVYFTSIQFGNAWFCFRRMSLVVSYPITRSRKSTSQLSIQGCLWSSSTTQKGPSYCRPNYRPRKH